MERDRRPRLDGIAAAAREFLAAHDRRHADCEFTTLNERSALWTLRNELAALEREESSPATGTAA